MTGAFDVDEWYAEAKIRGALPLTDEQRGDPHVVLAAHMWRGADVVTRVICRRCGSTVAVVVDPTTAQPQRFPDGIVIDPRAGKCRRLLVVKVRPRVGLVPDPKIAPNEGLRLRPRRGSEMRCAALDRPRAPAKIHVQCSCGSKTVLLTTQLVRHRETSLHV